MSEFVTVRPMDLSIAIVSWNTKGLLEECLESIFNTTHDIDFEVIVVDNASSDGSIDMVHEKYPQVLLVESAENVGFARANNKAYEVSSGRHFMILNPDTKVLSDIGPIVRFLDDNESVGAAGCRCVNSDMSIQRNWFDYYPSFFWELIPYSARELAQKLLFQRSVDNQFDTKWVGGQCMTVRREVIESVGGMDPGYFMYSEETDWCFRIRKAGWRICHYPEIAILHYGGQSTKQMQSRMLIELYRSKFQFMGKNISAHKARAFVRGLMVKTWIQRSIMRLQGKVSNDGYAALTELQKSIRSW